jgi:hypothetical protein
MKLRKSLALASAVCSCAVVAGLLAAGAAQATTATTGTVSGTLTTQGGAPLNGMCVNLYKTSYKGKKITTAPTGTGGTNGLFTQANVPTGTYLAFF